ncbi:MAG TPA: MFS transporter [Bacteroidota bacterium]
MRKWGEDWSPAERRNFTANVMDGALFALGLSFVSQQTVLPVFVRNIGGGNIAVGLVPVVWTFGFNFTQIFIAARAQREHRKKALLLKTALIQRTPWLLLAVLSFVVFPRVGTGVALLLFFVVYALAAIGGGINLPVWFDLIAHVTPLTRRGRLFAVRSVFGSILGMLGGATAAGVLSLLAYPASYALLSLLAFCAMMLSWYSLTLLEAPDGAPADGTGPVWWDRSLVRRILRTPGNYRRFLVGDALLISSGMANGFFAVNALEKFRLPDAYAGTFTIIMAGSMILGSPAFGTVADKLGHRINMLLAGCATFLACLVALLAPSVEFYGLVFVLTSASVTLMGISRLPLLAELSSAAERPARVAVSNMLTSPFVLAGILGGWLANRFGFTPVFVTAGVIAGLALLWWLLMVQEPRKSRPGVSRTIAPDIARS